jgi:hypothetical protein
MTRLLLVTTAMFGLAGGAFAQYPNSPYPVPNYLPNIMPNVYNPQYQPLSPYLNLLRGGNTGVNYYYGVRPGTVSGGTSPFGGATLGGGGNRALFFPQLASAPDPFQAGVPGVGDVLPPAGHAVTFNNTMGYFPSPGGSRGGAQPGLAGVGKTRPPAKK